MNGLTWKKEGRDDDNDGETKTVEKIVAIAWNFQAITTK